MMTDPSPSTRGLKIALAVSVALNLGIAGLIGGIAWHGGPGGRGDMMVRDFGFGPFNDALSPEDRQALRQSVMDRAGDIRVARRQMQADGANILAALRAEPFDPAALAAVIDAQAGHLGERLKFGSDVIRDHILGLSPEARAAFADRLERRMRHGRDDDRPPG
jgi:uncharacterized membrane protein